MNPAGGPRSNQVGGAQAGRRLQVEDGVEPQGEALIFELRKLQRALDLERKERSAPAPDRGERERSGGAGKRKKRNAPERPKTRGGPLRRAVAACLETMGMGAPSAVSRSGAVLTFEHEPMAISPFELRCGLADAARLGRGDASDERAAVEQAPNAKEAPLRPVFAPPPAVQTAIKQGAALLRGGVAFLVDRSRGRTLESAPGSGFAEKVGHAYEDELRTALRVLVIGVVVIGGWATLVPLSGAVVLPGSLVVESSVKKVQHLGGGVVADIRARDGARVDAGELLVRLDDTQARTSRQLLANQINQIRMRIARLVAERDGAQTLQVPNDVAKHMDDDGVRQLVASETSLFNARASAKRSQKELLQSNINQFEEQIAGLEAQIKSKSSQIELIANELAGVQDLYGKGLVPLTRLTTLQREAARLEGERGQLVSAIAETKAKIGQAQLQIVRTDQDFQTEVMKDLRESQNGEAEIAEKFVAAQDQLDKIEIRAPATGIVHELSVHTVGGVIRPGEVIMQIVPDSDDLEIEARLPPQQIDQVHRGQTAFLRFSAFNQRTTPEVSGVVSYVSADLSHEAQTAAAYYTVRINLPGSERRRLGGLTLLSGMPVEAFLQTGSRTMLSYLSKPIADQFRRMFNER